MAYISGPTAQRLPTERYVKPQRHPHVTRIYSGAYIASDEEFGGFLSKLKKAISIKNVVKVVKKAAPLALAIGTGGVGVGIAAAIKTGSSLVSGLVRSSQTAPAGTSSASGSGLGFLVKSAISKAATAASVRLSQQQAPGAPPVYVPGMSDVQYQSVREALTPANQQQFDVERPASLPVVYDTRPQLPTIQQKRPRQDQQQGSAASMLSGNALPIALAVVGAALLLKRK